MNQEQNEELNSAAEQSLEQDEVVTSKNSDPEAEISEEKAALQKELETAKLEARENYDKYVRAVAQMENIRKRSEKERLDASQFALESFSKDLLPVLDSLGKALSVEKKSDASDSILEGIHLVQKQLLETLHRHGLEEVQSLGLRFDPKVHQAISRQEKVEITEEIVAIEYSKGYVLNGRLLRPAMVLVEVPPSA